MKRRAIIVMWSLGLWAIVGLVSLSADQLLDDRAMWAREDGFISASNYARLTPRLGDPHVNRQENILPGEGSERRLRILVVGDSFVWGDGATDTATAWPRALQTVMDDRLGAGRVEVTALANNGAATMNQLDWLTPAVLGRLRPDAVVFGYVTNDSVPRGRKDSATCFGYWCYGIKQYEEDKPYLACMQGEGSWFATLMHQTAAWLPALTRSMTANYCLADGEANASDAVGYPFYHFLRRILAEDALAAYRVTAARMRTTVGQQMPLFILPTPIRPSDFELARRPLEILRGGGATIIPIPRTTPFVRFEDPSVLMINPVNAHPSPRLAHRLAEDAADTLLADPRTAEILPAGGETPPDTRRLTAGFLPTYLQISERGGGAADISAHPSGRPVIETTLNIAGHMLPGQTAPCADLGRPHSEIDLVDAARRNVVGLRAQVGPDAVAVEVASFGYTPDMTLIMSAAVRVAPGRTAIVPTMSPGVRVAGVYVWSAAQARGCPVNQRIDLIPFAITLRPTYAR